MCPQTLHVRACLCVHVYMCIRICIDTHTHTYIFAGRARVSCTLDNTGVIRFPQNCRACPAQIEFLLIKTGISVACVFSPPPPLILPRPSPHLAFSLPFRPPRLRGLLSLSLFCFRFARPPRSLSRARARAPCRLAPRPPLQSTPCPSPLSRPTRSFNLPVSLPVYRDV